MAKHRRFSDKPNDNSIQNNDQTELQEQETNEKTSLDLKTILLSGTKYAYIIGAVALLSGIFTPLTLDVEIEEVIFGMLSIFLGLVGGIVIFLGIKTQKFTTIMVCGGLGMIFGSLILIYQSTNNPLIN
ncbi:hypothetical protein OAJ04_00605 [Candidatus Nitrosopelagicus sp.]|nr:hypothetical protein [Candidatus Nitrosopelagicus sp.]